jgi:hypothetical protein
MKADLKKPHIYVDGVAVNTEVAKNAHELLQVLIHVSACLEYGDDPIHLKKDIERAIEKAKL